MSGPPCYGCSDRCIGCHGKCPRYSSWNEKHIEQNKKKFIDQLADVYIAETASRKHRAHMKQLKNHGF